ncbi:LOW QUALITY PROTEIN: hypothetical protein CFC21_089004 [Triticum aestivum]|uniref:Phytocyanin domain-containing protein n=2 Tax=Triticum aestivum TaxID=4565 RepID=A0A9R1LCE4_WHEAT|nr:LOW QUALITY PROTEIN: hypothetical protein CFC21_089004 [Triticum aestivum]
MSSVFATSHRAAATGILFLAAAMHQHVAGAAPAAAVYHVVGGDPGWAVASDVLAWSAGRLFTVGDTLWFTYEPAEDGVAEVTGEAEFGSCEAGHPIRTYTDGLSRVGLDDEGTRYFLSADPAKCKGGLKLRVDVRATVSVSPRSEDRAAAAAPAPSASSGTQAAAPLMRSALCLVSVWCFLFLGA